VEISSNLQEIHQQMK